MALKTKVSAGNGSQEVEISRDFELPVHLLFKAYIEADLVEQWMGTKVIKLENTTHGSYKFETTDPMGNKHIFHGVIHEIITNQTITRTFEMANTPFPTQLEFLQFIQLTENTSRLNMHVVYKTPEIRDQMLQLPFAQGVNMAHNKIELIFNK